MNNTQLAAEVAALRERINTLERIVSDDYHASTVTADDFTTPEPQTPAPDDAVKWEAVSKVTRSWIRNGDIFLAGKASVHEAFRQGLAIDPARLVVTDAMVEQVYQDLIAADDNVRYNAKRCVAFVLEAALAAVKGDSNGK